MTLLINIKEQLPNETPSPSLKTESEASEPQRHRWTPEEYMELGALESFQQRRTELIDGEIYDVSSQKNPHAFAISRTNRLLVAAFDEEHYWLTVQSTVKLPLGDIPDPDFAVRPGSGSADDSHHPVPSLVIEVSDSTLLFDQFVKSSVYAANGVGDYWIINIPDRQIEVYRDPVPAAGRKHGFHYATVNTFRSGASITPLAAPNVTFEVDKMLP